MLDVLTTLGQSVSSDIATGSLRAALLEYLGSLLLAGWFIRGCVRKYLRYSHPPQQ